MNLMVKTTALATAMPATIATAAVGQDDPVFAAITRHKKALEIVRGLSDDIDQMGAAAEAAVGPCGIQIPDPNDPTGTTLVTAHNLPEIEEFVPDDVALQRFYLDQLSKKIGKRSRKMKKLGYARLQKAFDRACHEENKAADALAETKPTTVRGLLVLLQHVQSTQSAFPTCKGTFDENNLPILVRSLGEAAERLVA